MRLAQTAGHWWRAGAALKELAADKR